MAPRETAPLYLNTDQQHEKGWANVTSRYVCSKKQEGWKLLRSLLRAADETAVARRRVIYSNEASHK